MLIRMMNRVSLYSRNIVDNVGTFNDISFINNNSWNDIGTTMISCEHVMNNNSCANVGSMTPPKSPPKYQAIMYE